MQRLSARSWGAKQRLERLEVVKKRMIERGRAAERRRRAELAREQAAREAAAQAAADAAANAAAPAPTYNEDDDAYVPPAPDPLDGYTGPRCYEPGGVVWHPC
jgi:micrococcal nuclease